MRAGEQTMTGPNAATRRVGARRRLRADRAPLSPPDPHLALRVSRWIWLTVARDRHGWHFAAWRHARGKRLDRPARSVRDRHFRSWEDAAEFFRAVYARGLSGR
jgi:hypothetical protein